MDRVRIANHWIGKDCPVFIVAEIGINHGGSVDMATKMIAAAKEAGADAVKFQSYITEKRAGEDNPLFPILKKCELSEKDHVRLFKVARKKRIIFFSTPFDEKSADFLEELGVPIFKIASFYITHHRLIRHLAAKRKPIILSRGMARKKEIDSAVKIIRRYGTPFILLHCISSYPTKEDDVNLAVIQTLKNLYRVPVGFSDHTDGINIPVLAVAAGAKVIEKHFTLSKKMSGPDHKLSLIPKEFKEMVQQIRRVETALGSPKIRRLPTEKTILPFRVYSK